MAISTRWQPSPVTRPTFAFDRSAPLELQVKFDEKVMASSRGSTTIPTLSIRLRAITPPLILNPMLSAPLYSIDIPKGGSRQKDSYRDGLHQCHLSGGLGFTAANAQAYLESEHLIGCVLG